jgi:hypothetical protein
MLRLQRLTLRLLGFELASVAALTALLAGAALFVAARLDQVGLTADCLVEPDHAYPVHCQALVDRFSVIARAEAGPVIVAALALPYLTGLFLGVPVVAREVETGTARLAWSLAPSRLRWYVGRLIPVLLAIATLTFAQGVAVDRLYAATWVGVDPSNSFESFGQRGIILMASGIVAGAAAVAMGALLGRVLPALLLAGVVAIGTALAVSTIHAEFTATEAVLIDAELFSSGDRLIEEYFRLPDGRLVTTPELQTIDPNAGSSTSYPRVALVIKGERYRAVEAREAITLMLPALVLLTLAAFVVRRRRPE